MRAPTLGSRLKVRQTQGLAHVLAGLGTNQNVIANSELHPNLKVITSGEMPPNPAELLGSARMGKLFDLLRKMFDYIVLDLPPVTVVADALAASDVLDGMIVVVEEGVCTKWELADAMQRLEVIQEKVLGFVVTHAEGSKGRYGKKRYGYGYGYKNRNGDQ